MISKDYITAWRACVPWIQDAQVEQDLVISRALVELFQISELANSLAFRGGTALYKLYFNPPARYSEDIDLVQIRAEPIGKTLDLARSVLDPWLGVPRRQLKAGRANLVYRFNSEGTPPLKLRLKIEINTREHFAKMGIFRVPFKVDNPWFKGATEIPTYKLDELLATKLRALYQRKKGRDLFDIWHALNSGLIDKKVLLECFSYYMSQEGKTITRAQFEKNLADKRLQPGFRDDVQILLRPGYSWNFDCAIDEVLVDLISKISGEPWQGNKTKKR